MTVTQGAQKFVFFSKAPRCLGRQCRNTLGGNSKPKDSKGHLLYAPGTSPAGLSGGVALIFLHNTDSWPHLAPHMALHPHQEGQQETCREIGSVTSHQGAVSRTLSQAGVQLRGETLGDWPVFLWPAVLSSLNRPAFPLSMVRTKILQP